MSKSDWPLHKKACTLCAVKLLIDAISDNNSKQVEIEITRLSKTKRVANGKVDYTYKKEDNDGNEVTLAQWTALHACVRSGNIAAMKILLQNGAKTEIQDADGETPLF
jgi:Ankyrin repeat